MLTVFTFHATKAVQQIAALGFDVELVNNFSKMGNLGFLFAEISQDP